MKLEKKHIILACTLLILIIVLVYRFLNPFKQQEVHTLTHGPSAGVKLSEEKGEKMGFEKAVDRYFAENKHNGATHKNLFVSGPRPVKKHAPAPVKKPEKRRCSRTGHNRNPKRSGYGSQGAPDRISVLRQL